MSNTEDPRVQGNELKTVLKQAALSFLLKEGYGLSVALLGFISAKLERVFQRLDSSAAPAVPDPIPSRKKKAVRPPSTPDVSGGS